MYTFWRNPSEAYFLAERATCQQQECHGTKLTTTSEATVKKGSKCYLNRKPRTPYFVYSFHAMAWL